MWTGFKWQEQTMGSSNETLDLIMGGNLIS
jgi:hypothetical protein